jgi:hypothetical protein
MKLCIYYDLYIYDIITMASSGLRKNHYPIMRIEQTTNQAIHLDVLEYYVSVRSKSINITYNDQTYQAFVIDGHTVYLEFISPIVFKIIINRQQRFVRWVRINGSLKIIEVINDNILSL